MAIVTQTDLPKSVRNRCVIKVFGGVFVLSRSLLDFSVGVGAFVIGLSQISSFFSSYSNNHYFVFVSNILNHVCFSRICVMSIYLCILLDPHS